MQPWCPFATKRASPNISDDRLLPIKAVVLHIAQGGAVGSLDWLTNPKSQVSSHFFITKAGEIVQLVPLDKTAWANGLRWAGQWLTPSGKPVKPRWTGLIAGKNPNRYTISIEHEGKTGEPLTTAMAEAQNKLLIWLAGQCGWPTYAVGQNLIGHGDINPIDRPFCPGTAFDLGLIATRANGGSDMTLPANALLTERSTLFGKTQANKDKVIALIKKRGSAYDLVSVRSIVETVFNLCALVDIPAEIVIAQQFIETSDQADSDAELEPYSSYWAKRPHRNPAGIGVTGAPGFGVSFPTWVDGIQAEIGRLLRYFLADGVGTEAQQALMSTALYWRKLDERAWGSCTQLKHLGAMHNPANAGLPRNKWVAGWAWDGEFYGAKIANVATMLRGL